MANIGMADTLILMVLALVVFGPRRLPQIGRQIGKLMYEFRKASNDFKFQMEEELRQAEEADRRKKEEEERQKALAAVPPSAQIAPPAASTAESAPTTLESPATPSESPAASPYPGVSTFPDLAAEGTRPEESAEDTTAAAVEAARLRIEPRIQPPSTGEVVAAERPRGEVVAAEPPGPPPPEPAAGNVANDNLSGANEAGQIETEKSEPAAHHG